MTGHGDAYAALDGVWQIGGREAAEAWWAARRGALPCWSCRDAPAEVLWQPFRSPGWAEEQSVSGRRKARAWRAQGMDSSSGQPERDEALAPTPLCVWCERLWQRPTAELQQAFRRLRLDHPAGRGQYVRHFARDCGVGRARVLALESGEPIERWVVARVLGYLGLEPPAVFRPARDVLRAERARELEGA